MPEGCTETPDGNVVRVFELNDVCGGVTPTLAMDEACTDDNTYLLECYDKCQTLEPCALSGFGFERSCATPF